MMSNLVCFCWIFTFCFVITFGHVCFWPGAFTSLDWDCRTRKLSFQGLFRLVKSDYLPHCLTTKAAQSDMCLPKTSFFGGRENKSIFFDVFVEWKNQFDGDFGSVWSVCLFFVCCWLVVCFFVFCLYYVHLCSIPSCERSPNSLMFFSQRLNGYNAEFAFYSSFKQVRSYSSHTSSHIPDFCVLFDGLNHSLNMIGIHKESATGHFWIACWYGLYWAAYHSREQPLMKTTNSNLRLQFFFLWVAHVVLIPIPSMYDIISLFTYIP